MKNKEKYAKEILDIVIKECHFALNKDGEIVRCSDIKCSDCLFNVKEGCNSATIEWANAEYIKPKQFTEREKAFVKLFPAFQYIAKDKNGYVYAFTSKPVKSAEWWTRTDGYGLLIHDCMALPFYDIRWEDKEPTSREEILKGT